MSTINTAKVQIGQSSTPSQNFTLLQNNDGTLSIVRGNSGTPISVLFKINADDSVEFPADPDFTIIYPNGGSAGSPVKLYGRTRYVEANPFPGFRVLCELEVLYNGQWTKIRHSSSGTNFYGGFAAQHNDSDIAVVTSDFALGASALATRTAPPPAGGITWANAVITGSRVLVWKVKGAVV
jgi:hypothetical protein